MPFYCLFHVCLILTTIIPSSTLIAPLQSSNGEVDINSMATHILLLEQTVQRLETTVGDFKSELQSKTNEIDILKTDYAALDQRLSVALNTSFGCSGPEVAYEVIEIPVTTHSVGAGNTIIFSNVTHNAGGAYHVGSGIFRAPVGGIYLVWAHILEGAGKPLAIDLMKEGTLVSRGYTPGGTVYGTASIIAIVDVRKNDDIWFKSDDSTISTIHGNSHSSYGGVLLCKH